MITFEVVLTLLLGGVGLTLLAGRLGVPWPALLAIAGAALALFPGVPSVVLDPRLALALFVAPVLLDAAFDASLRDLRANWAAMVSLVFVLVLLTTLAVAVVARWIEPNLSWAAALTLGAIVAPPDAAAAAALLRQVRLPRRMTMILEGESLLNDATALLIYRLAVAWAVAGHGGGGPAVFGAVSAAVVGVALGLALAWLVWAMMARVHDWAAHVVLQFLSTFAVWLLAEALDLSAVLAMVGYAMMMARLTATGMGARHRRASYAVWEAVVFVLNILAFILVGLQLRGVTERLGGRAPHFLLFAAAVLATTILVRFAWVMIYLGVLTWKNRRFGVSPGTRGRPSLRGGIIVAWCGMRGIVTLATALALPQAFPGRDLVVFAAFCVVLGTLAGQGMTLRLLIGALALPQDDSYESERMTARREAARAALQALEDDREQDSARTLIREYESLLSTPDVTRGDSTGIAAMRARALAAERSCLIALRRSGQIGDDVFHVVEEELDWLEADLEGRDR